jgi:hypothetical protein
MKQWIAVGTQVSAQAMRKLAEHNIQLRTESIRHIEGTNGELTKIVFEGGPDLPRAGLFFLDRLPSGVRPIRTPWLQT